MMATLTISIPDDVTLEVCEFIASIGGKVISKTSSPVHTRNIIAEIEQELNFAFENLERKTKHRIYMEDLKNYIGVSIFAKKNFTTEDTEEEQPSGNPSAN